MEFTPGEHFHVNMPHYSFIHHPTPSPFDVGPVSHFGGAIYYCNFSKPTVSNESVSDIDG